MDEKLDRQEGVVIFQEEKPKQTEPTTPRQDTTTVTISAKEKSAGRGVIALVSIGIVGTMTVGATQGLGGPTTAGGIVAWLVGIGIVVLIAKWAW